ncbi:MAG TPA: SusC/RagA family TonB-linked outer membrane protein [Paludibacteraceae bacterium]|nr:SusC/RagA family TonB-linked outer membrane protein [Paludibacteraceae bacterium]
MRKLKFLLTCLLMVSISLVSAQTKTASGTVTSADNGEPVIGASVLIKGTSQGTITNVNGKFTLTVPANATLVISSIGLISQEAVPGTNMEIVLLTDTKTLDEVVVTALGIQRQKRDLGYSTANINSEELTQAKSVSVATGLQGKVAGLNIASLNNGVFEDVKINLRGIRSLTGNNNPMLLLDGVPVGLGLLNTINPNDVESVNVLKGTSAAAIYGPDARNGVIVVTTKAGSKSDKPEITISNSTQFNSVSFFPKFQTSFGSGGYGSYIPYENWSWGPAFDGSEVELGEVLPDGKSVQKVTYSPIKNNRQNFFNTGVTMQNDISYSAKNFYLSIQDANIKGVVPDDVNRRTGIRMNASQTYKKFTASFNTNYIQSNYNVFDNVAMGDYYSANNVGLNDGLMNLIFSTQAHVPITTYKDFVNNPFAQYNNYYNRYGINPYIALDTWRRKGKDQNLVSSLDLKLAATDWLDLNYRAAMTYQSIVAQSNQKRLVVTPYGKARGIDAVPQAVSNGSYVGNRLSSEFFANFHKTFGDFKVNALAGTYVRDVLSRSTGVNSSNLIVEGLFNVSARPGELGGYSTESHTRLFSLYGNLNLNYKNWANLEITGRNDKTSVLDPTNNSFFYPGVAGSLVLTDAIPALKSDVMNFLKLRASWNKTGNADISPYLLSATFSQGDGFPYNGLPGYSADDTSYDRYLKPEFINSKEAGFEASFLKNRITIDASYYDQDNTNQIVSIRVPRSTGYTFAFVNAASFRNYGFETQLKVTPLVNFGDVNVNINANYSYNNSEVLSIYQDLQELSIGGYVMAGNQAVVGQPAFIFNASDYQRDDKGRVVVDRLTGYPIVDPVNKKFGRTMPMHIIGLNPSISWKGLTVSALFEYKGGHYAFNMIGNEMAWTGVSEITGVNNRERFVIPNSVYEDPKNPGKYIENTNITVSDVQDFFTGDSYRTVASNFITSAASWRFREFSVTYDLPKSLLKGQNLIQGVTVGVNGRNIALWLPKSNVYSDPDFKDLDSFGGNIAGIANATVNPPVRTLGGTISVKF